MDRPIVRRLMAASLTSDLSTLHEFSSKLISTVKNENGESVLHIATAHDQLDCVEHLLSTLHHHSLIHEKDTRGYTPLWMPIRLGHIRILVYFIECVDSKLTP